jgi:hypothetical protein
MGLLSSEYSPPANTSLDRIKQGYMTWGASREVARQNAAAAAVAAARYGPPPATSGQPSTLSRIFQTVIPGASQPVVLPADANYDRAGTLQSLSNNMGGLLAAIGLGETSGVAQPVYVKDQIGGFPAPVAQGPDMTQMLMIGGLALAVFFAFKKGK